MKRLRWLLLIALLVTLVAPNVAGAEPSGPLSVLALTVLPAPAVAGTTTFVNWDADLSGTGTVSFRAYIPADWYNSVDWKAGTGVTVVQTSALVYSVTSCADTSIGGIPVICALYSADNSGLGETVESISLSFTLSASATTGDNRPVRVTHVSGSGGPPNLSTVYVTVTGAPSIRYVGNTGCGGNSPCNTGPSALADAIAALPSTGGTIYVYGAYEADGAALGARNITLRPVDASSSLNAGACTASGNRLIGLDGTGNLVVDGLTVVGDDYNPPGDCFVGVDVTGSGNLSVQNNAVFQNWFGDGVAAGYGVSIAGTGTHNISAATFSGNATGLHVANGTTTVNSSTFSGNSSNAVMVDGAAATLTVQNSALNTSSSDGLYQDDGTITLRGNTITNNGDYAFVNAGGAMIAYANNLSNNNGGGFQAYVNSQVAAAKNWWGDAHNAAVGPTADGSNLYATGWSRRLGAAVSSWATGANNATLGNAALSGGTGTAVIIGFGRGSLHAPFGVGVPPFVNQVCSDYYDFYVLPGGSGNWTVALPIDLSLTGCQSNVLFSEVAYTIDPATYDTQCTPDNNPSCWDRIPIGSILADTVNNRLLITQSAAQLEYTHIVAGDATGADPTAVVLSDFAATASARSSSLWLMLFVAASVPAALWLWRRRLARHIARSK